MIWYSVSKALPVARGIDVQLKYGETSPVSACMATPQRFGADATPGEQVPPETSGSVPSIIFSMDPDVSRRMSVFGKGGFTSTS